MKLSLVIQKIVFLYLKIFFECLDEYKDSFQDITSTPADMIQSLFLHHISMLYDYYYPKYSPKTIDFLINEINIIKSEFDCNSVSFNVGFSRNTYHIINLCIDTDRVMDLEKTILKLKDVEKLKGTYKIHSINKDDTHISLPLEYIR